MSPFFLLVATATSVSAPSSIDDSDPDLGFVGPVLPVSLDQRGGSFWTVGVAFESYARALDDPEGLAGLSVAFRSAAFAPHALLMVAPGEGYQDLRTLGGLGLRAYFPLLGTTWSYGVGAHFEARLNDHFWVTYATPLELGTTLYSEGSWVIELFVGARRAFAGRLIENFLLDPNGFNNENARDELDVVTKLEPWRGFVRVVFGRRLD
jgi:hypothetical protein